MPKISVLMPCKHLNEECRKSIESILEQQGVDLELIITLDGGENSLKIYDDRVKIDVFDRNYGAIQAINNCYKFASGEYITVHDNDDWSEPNRFITCLDAIGTNRALTSNLTIVKNGTLTKKVFHTDNFYYKGIRIKPPAHHCATLIRRDLWDEIGPYNELYICSDSLRMIKLAIYLKLNKENFPVLDQQLYNYVVRDKSLSKSGKWRAQVGKSRKKIFEQYEQIMKMSPGQFLQWCKNNFL